MTSSTPDFKQLTDDELIRMRDAVDAELRTRTTPVQVVVNTCYGGFSLNVFGEDILQASGFNLRYVGDIPRNHPVLTSMVERFGQDVAGECSTLSVKTVDVPLGYTWRINEYDGKETVEVQPGTMPPPAVISSEQIARVLDVAATWPRDRSMRPMPISSGWSDDDSSGSDDDGDKK